MANGLLKLVLGAGLAAGLGASANAQDWQEYNGHLYALTPTPMSWSSAESYATGLGGMDAHLATINDPDENEWITNEVTTFSADFWMGFYQPEPRDEEPAGGWEWISEEPVTYVNWAWNEPNNAGGAEHFGYFNGNAGTWGDYPPHVSTYGIVESPIPEPSTLALLVAGAVGMGATRRRK